MASFKGRKSSVHNFASSSSSSNLHIPEDIMIDILSRLPVKSLTRFSCVSKAWLSLIRHNSSFVSKHLAHSTLNTKGGNLLVTSQQLSNTRTNTDTDIYLDVFLDGAFDAPIHSGKVLPSPWTEVDDRNIICSNNGILCIDAHTYHSYVIWNPATRQFREIPKHGLDRDTDAFTRWLFLGCKGANPRWRFLGFGVDVETNDYKLICLRPHYTRDENKNHISLMRVYLYSKSTGLWRDFDAPALTTINDHRIAVHDCWSQIQIKGVLYWVPKSLQPSSKDQIMRFEIREETFSLLSIPDYYKSNESTLACELTEIEGSLALIASKLDGRDDVYNIWMMNNEESWVNKFMVPHPSIETLIISTHGWKNCLVTFSWKESEEPKLSVQRVDGVSSSVVQQIKNLSRDVRNYSLEVHRYVESLTPV